MKAVIRAAVGTTSGVDPHRRKREADLKSLASRFRNGDKTAPSQAIQLCMKDEIPSEEWPEWIKEGFLKYGPSGGKLKYQPAWRRKDCFEIWWCVQELRREAPQSSDVFGLVAKEFNTSPAMVKRCVEGLTDELKKALTPQQWRSVVRENQLKIRFKKG